MRETDGVSLRGSDSPGYHNPEGQLEETGRVEELGNLMLGWPRTVVVTRGPLLFYLALVVSLGITGFLWLAKYT